jgi:hypothetical protein
MLYVVNKDIVRVKEHEAVLWVGAFLPDDKVKFRVLVACIDGEY